MNMGNGKASMLVFLRAILFAGCVAAAQTSTPTAPPADSNQAPDPNRAAPSSQTPADETSVVYYRYKVIRSYPHDRRAFTQGLVYENGILYEGTGLYGRSSIAKRDLKTGATLKTLRLPARYFGEGITLFGDRLIELTWKSRVGFVYSKDTFTLRRQFSYPMEGWGLTHDGKRLILSDGTATLRFLDPNTYAETGRLAVYHEGRPLRNLNELEFIDGRIFANVWLTDTIVIISPKTGRVTGLVDMADLYPASDRGDSDAVLNGIAYLPETRHLLVTGKLWPRLFEIELVEKTP
jgi:glutamine cyclotransferase